MARAHHVVASLLLCHTACSDDGVTSSTGGDGGAASSTATGSPGGGDQGGSSGTGGQGGGAPSEVYGIVTAYRANPLGLESLIVGATVEITDGTSTWTAVSDGNGLFAISDVPPGDGYVARVIPPEPLPGYTIQLHPGPFAEWVERFTVLDGTATPLMPVLVGGCSVSTYVESGETILATASFACSNADIAGELRVPSGGLVDGNGDPVTGLVRLDFSPLHYPLASAGPPDLRSTVSMPGELLGSAGGQPAEPIHTFAAADLSVYNAESGEKLGLAPGVTATVRMRGWRPLEGSDPDPLSWSFDPETQTWIEEGACTVDPVDPQYVLCDVAHFSWWNADRRTREDDDDDPSGWRMSCVQGVVEYDEAPVWGAAVAAITNEGIASGAEGVTNGDGSFCIDGPADRDWSVQVRMPNGREVLRGTGSVAAAPGLGNCGRPTSCAAAGTIQLSTTPTITVRGELGLCDGELYPEEICGPMPAGGFEFGSTVRVIGQLPGGTAQFYLGEATVGADGRYELKVPEGIDSLAFSSPPDGFCVTYFTAIPGQGDPVELERADFICGS